jgi:hypothetical protein
MILGLGVEFAQRGYSLFFRVGAFMSFFLFCAGLLLLLFSLLFDLRAKRLLSLGVQTQETQAILKFWPLQVLLHLVLLYGIASTPIFPQRPVQVKASFRTAVPRPFIPSFPPAATEWKKQRVEHL